MIESGQVAYISGAMSGMPDHNVPAFTKAAKALRKAGFIVRNPAENDNNSRGKTWAFYMRMDVQHVALSDAIILLDGWENSRGVQLEIAIAQRLEIPIYRMEILPENTLIFEEIFPIVTVEVKAKPDCLVGAR